MAQASRGTGGAALLYVTDERGLELTRHAAAAAMLTQAGPYAYMIFCHGFEPGPDPALEALARERGSSFEMRPITSPYAEVASVTHVTMTSFLKLKAVLEAAQEYDRVVYSDGDILMMRDLDLAGIDMQGFPIAAGYDLSEAGGLLPHDRAPDHPGRGAREHYFNTGLIVADGALWRGEAFAAPYAAAMRAHLTFCEYKSACVTMDQCVWNLLFEGRWARLPLDHNMQACALFSRWWSKASLRHYTGKIKFLPIRLWRSDVKDRRLIARARRRLGLSVSPMTETPDVLFALNRLRNARLNARVARAVEKVERKRAAPFAS